MENLTVILSAKTTQAQAGENEVTKSHVCTSAARIQISVANSLRLFGSFFFDKNESLESLKEDRLMRLQRRSAC
jgi:hypothetical protein